MDEEEDVSSARVLAAEFEYDIGDKQHYEQPGALRIAATEPQLDPALHGRKVSRKMLEEEEEQDVEEEGTLNSDEEPFVFDQEPKSAKLLMPVRVHTYWVSI